MKDPDQVREQLVTLETEHRDLDLAIDLLMQVGRLDDLQLRRFKKRKLQIKDQIIHLKMQLVPDIPA
ncbi:MAG: hypothetical protein RI984_1308 [Pseudomonadota bacterium]|jgi:hypothetical protein